MRRIFWGDNAAPETREALKTYVARRIWPDGDETFGECVCMGVEIDGMPAGAVVYHDYNPRAGVIEMSAAADDKRWLSRDVLREMFDYPFKGLRVQMVVTRVSADARQKHLHRIFWAYGFKSQCIPRLFGRFEDGLLFRLTDDDWEASKFNGGCHGQTEGPSAT